MTIAPNFYTWQQLQEQFPDQYVLLAEPVRDFHTIPGFGGRLIYANRNERKVAKRTADLTLTQRFSIVFTGPFDTNPDTVFVL